MAATVAPCTLVRGINANLAISHLEGNIEIEVRDAHGRGPSFHLTPEVLDVLVEALDRYKTEALAFHRKGE